ncbi:oxidoreductase [Streptomyces sp. NPDC052236]|uniref:oxidoreductase n=1 Tax=Streptomyces sp. NPDC052236 TaxID=3365686 RepID=UPI0037CE6503
MLQFEELTAAERALWTAFPTGRWVDLRTGDPAQDDPVGAESWGEERTVRAAVIAALLLSGPGDATGAVRALRLAGARITGPLDLAGARVDHPVRIEGCGFDHQVVLRGAELRSTELIGCRIPGLDGWLLRVEGNLFFENSHLDGRLTLTRAHITGELRLSGVRLTARELLGDTPNDPACAPGVWALWAGGLVLDGGCFGRHGFSSRGGLRLPGAQFNGGLFLEGAHIENPGGDALTGDDMTVSTMALSDGFTACGTVRLTGATVRSVLSLDAAVLTGADTALDAGRLTAGDFRLTPAAGPKGTVDLREAQVAVLHDNEHSWPEHTLLTGFVYTSLQSPLGFTERLRWIEHSPGYVPQPYEQLATWYRRIGHDDDARRVLLAKQRRRRRTLHPLGRAWGRMLDVTVGYGYRPWQAALWLVSLIALGVAGFQRGTPHAAQKDQKVPFDAFVYTLDLLIPIGGFGQRTLWYWDGPLQWLAYALIAAGWLLTTVVFAGVTRSLNRN